MKYILFTTINKNNNKIYIGVHETENPYKFDGYIGDGVNINIPNTYNKNKFHLHNAILKYGTSAFYRITLRVFDSFEEAIQLRDSFLVEDFIKDTNTYNSIFINNPNFNYKYIYQYNLEGELIHKWNVLEDILDIFKTTKDRLITCIKKKLSLNNFYWSINSKIDISEYRINKGEHIYQYNKQGILLNVYNDTSEASFKLDIDIKAIISSLFKRTLCCGYYFLREKEDINLILNQSSSKGLRSTIPVYRYLNSNELDKEYTSVIAASKDTPRTSQGKIIRAIKGNRLCGGYKWSYIKSDIYKPFRKREIKPIKVAQYDLNNKLIKIWDSITSCKKEYPCCQQVCKKELESYKGYIFKYIS